MSDEERLAEGSLISHLVELRQRLLKCVIAVAIVFAPCGWFANDLFTIIATPLIAKMPAGSSMIATSLISPFTAPLKLSFFVALFIAMPVVLYQVWQFVAPGLYKREKRLAIPLLISSILLFYSGIAFAYFIVFKVMFGFFVGVTPTGVDMTPDISAYLSFVLGIFLAFGLAFEVPIATVLLIWSGLVSVTTLKKVRPYMFLGAFVAGMLLAPDVFSMTLMAIPMYLLYEGGLIMARVLIPEKAAT